MEARMVRADVMILGGLNEGTFPKETEADPWMNRAMREEFGLPSLQRKIGLSSHDFVQAACAPEVILTRSEKVNGSPTIASRWLFRLDALIEKMNLSWPDTRSWIKLAQQFDRPEKVTPCTQPAPCPPRLARPQKLSVTQVEMWMRDPYSIYAKHILNLKPLEPLEKQPDMADFGSLVHAALEDFVQQKCSSSEELKELFDRKLHTDLPLSLVRFWLPRFERLAKWFTKKQMERKDHILKSFTEISGQFQITDHFTLTAKADRIDLLKNNTTTIIDYKTGSLPSKKEIFAGYAPQLPLEALLLEKGGFKDLGTMDVSELLYWQLGSGKGKDGGFEFALTEDISNLIDQAFIGLRKLIMEFEKRNNALFGSTASFLCTKIFRLFTSGPHTGMVECYS